MTTQIDLGFAPNEDPFVVAHGGFYRRWLSMLDDIEELKQTVARLEGTTEEKWVPVWEEVARRYEDEGDRLESAGDFDAASAMPISRPRPTTPSGGSPARSAR